MGKIKKVLTKNVYKKELRALRGFVVKKQSEILCVSILSSFTGKLGSVFGMCILQINVVSRDGGWEKVG